MREPIRDDLQIIKTLKMREIIKFGLMATVLAAFVFASCKKDDEEIINNDDKNQHKIDSVNYVIEGLNECFPDGVIKNILPAENSTSVDVFEKPQVVFNVPINTAIDSYYRASIAEFTVVKADGTKVDGDYTLSNDNLTCVFNIKEPYENGASYKVNVKVRFETEVAINCQEFIDDNGNVRLECDYAWQIIKDIDDNEYVKEKTTEFTAGNRPMSFNPQHILYSYPADRQMNFLPKETNQAYMIFDFDYSYLLNEYKAKGYEQKIRITPFGGETTTVDFTYTTATNGCGRGEIDYSVADLHLNNNVIYHLAVVNIAKDSSQTDASVPYEIYAIDFRTSSYNTFPEKMDNISYSASGDRWQIAGPICQLIWSFEDMSEVVESFDHYDYSLLRVNLDYDNCQWYKEVIAPLIYENEDVLSIVGNYTPPTKNVYVIGAIVDYLLTDEEVKTGVFAEHSNIGAFNCNASKYINNDYREIKTKLANTPEDKLTEGAKELLATEHFPFLIEGDYPMKIEYTLPGKNIVTSTYVCDLKYTHD